MDFSWLFLQMLVALVVVCLGAVLILRYVIPRLAWTKKWQRGKDFELVSRFGLDPRHVLYLVRIGKRFFALGGGEKGVSLLTEVPKEEMETVSDEERKKT